LIHDVFIVIMFGHNLELEFGILTLLVQLLNIRIVQYKMEVG